MNIGTQILNAFGHALSVLFSFVPALVGALVILLIGWIVASIVGALVRRLLNLVHFDQVMERTGLPEMLNRARVRTDPAGLLAGLVYWFIFLIFVVAAANALNIPAITALVTSIVLFLPNVFVALIILMIGLALARLVGDLVRGAAASIGAGGADLLAGIARWSVIAFAVIVALDQLRVSPAIIQTLFAAVAFGLALALAIAFGLGGRDTAKAIVDSTYTSLGGRNLPPASSTPTTQPTTAPTSATAPLAGAANGVMSGVSSGMDGAANGMNGMSNGVNGDIRNTPDQSR